MKQETKNEGEIHYIFEFDE
jgi:hypothetical protein